MVLAKLPDAHYIVGDIAAHVLDSRHVPKVDPLDVEFHKVPSNAHTCNFHTLVAPSSS